jgi:hypothetical protein
MAFQISYRFTHNNVVIDCGYCYKFRYVNYENDPAPHIFALYRIKGRNPNTGNFWNLLQAINLNYLPRSQRRAFVKDWTDVLRRSKSNFRLTWDFMKIRFPYMRLAIRRYYLDPSSYIQQLQYIPPEKMEAEIARNMVREYGMAALRKRGKTYRKTHPKPGKRQKTP